MQSEAPSVLNDPASQLAQDASPGVSAYVPELHDSHSVAPVRLTALPASHSTHCPWPVAAKSIEGGH